MSQNPQESPTFTIVEFADQAIENPFADPGFQEAANAKIEEINLNDYDPFGKYNQGDDNAEKQNSKEVSTPLGAKSKVTREEYLSLDAEESVSLLPQAGNYQSKTIKPQSSTPQTSNLYTQSSNVNSQNSFVNSPSSFPKSQSSFPNPQSGFPNSQSSYLNSQNSFSNSPSRILNSQSSTSNPQANTLFPQISPSFSSQKPLSLLELQKRQEELERKEKELKLREQQINQGLYNFQKKNWPPFPENFFLKPCFYQDIQCDIPYEFQKIVTQLYRLWFFHEGIMVANIIGGLITLNPHIIGIGVMYMIVYTPFSYLCWFRPAYKAFRSDSSINFLGFFLMFFFQFVITTIQAVGLPNSGSIGLITAIKSFTTSNALSAMCQMLIAFGFCAAAILDFVMLSKVHKIYKTTGASFSKAQEEFLRSRYATGGNLVGATRRN